MFTKKNLSIQYLGMILEYLIQNICPTCFSKIQQQEIRNPMKSYIKYFPLLVLILMSACKDTTGPESQSTKELVMFSGITMIDPIIELSALYEKNHPVMFKLTYGGSQDLAKSIEVNQLGDIYFPGVKKFVDEMYAKGHVKRFSQVGYNQISFFVQKGNPKNLTGNLMHLVDPNLSVVIGHQDLGSVGREARRILLKKGIYEDVVKNASFMASDSKGMTTALREKRADLVMNWRSVYYFKDNSNYIDEIPIEPGYADKNPLVISSLVYSEHPEFADGFIDLCISKTGKTVFSKYGF